MSRPSRAGAVCYEPESAWGEDVTTFATRVQTLGEVDASGLNHDKITPDRTVQFRNEITPGVDGIIGGEFKTRFALTGHGSTTATTIVLNALETLLGKVFGNVAAAFSAANTTLTGTGTKSAPGTTAANGIVAGSLVRIGALADGRGKGQFYGCASHSASVANLINELAGNPVNGDIVYNPGNIFGSESPTATDIIGQRFLLQTANLSFECHGCYPKAVTFSDLQPGEQMPSIEITWGVSWWRFSTATFPSAVAVQTFAHAPVASGSLFMNAQGTATRVVRDVRSFTLTYTLGIVELKGPGGVHANQVTVGCRRTQDQISMEWVEDADAQTATPDLATKWSANSPLSVVYTLSAADGSSVGFMWRYCVPDGPKPVQMSMDGLNRIRWRMRAGTDNTKSTDRERAAQVMALA
jgi:hypothetical protein